MRWPCTLQGGNPKRNKFAKTSLAMRMKILFTLFVAIFTITASAQTSIVGRWEVADQSEKTFMEFDLGLNLLMTSEGEELRFKYGVYYYSTPMKIDLTSVDDGSVLMYGILEFISENEVRMCLDLSGEGYPRDFEPEDDEQSIVMYRIQ